MGRNVLCKFITSVWSYPKLQLRAVHCRYCIATHVLVIAVVCSSRSVMLFNKLPLITLHQCWLLRSQLFVDDDWWRACVSSSSMINCHSPFAFQITVVVDSNCWRTCVCVCVCVCMQQRHNAIQQGGAEHNPQVWRWRTVQRRRRRRRSPGLILAISRYPPPEALVWVTQPAWSSLGTTTTPV